MASSSTQPASSSSSSASRWKYDVFLSFCGQDTRKGFTDHLYAALTRKGILTFRDDEKLPRGECFFEELLKAIQESMYAVVVISRNYVSSKWCLIELTEIIKCERKTGLNILPVFYHVEPHDLRNKKRTFAEAFAKHEHDPRIDMEMIQLWKASLKQVGYICGWHLQERYESTVVEEITARIFSQLNSRFSRLYRNLVGIDTSAEKMMKLLCMGLDDVRFIGICGMGGIGKTTLAKVIYDRVSYQFEASSFISSVRDKMGKNGLISLQNQLISEILTVKEIHIGDVRRGIHVIGTRMQNRKILIVLDDVDAETQLEALAGSHDWFGPGSRIIVTGKNSHLLMKHVDHLHEIEVLNNDEALKLFSLSAFKKLNPNEDYMDLSNCFIKYAQGLPLALKVLGSSLFGRTTYAWKSALDQLKVNPTKEILKVLEIGYDGPEDLQKKLFLDIACFFQGEVLDNVLMEILESFGYYPGINIDILMDKSLITTRYGRLEMHNLLQEMGKEIVRLESPIEPGQRSRLWHYDDVLHVLKNNTGTNVVEGIVLELPLDKNERLSIGGFTEMKNLRILKLNNIILAENLWDKLCATIGHRHPFESIPTKDLRILKWDAYPLRSLPTNFQANHLVELSIHGRDIKELWKGTKSFGSLKRLDLGRCSSLIKTPDFTEIPNLEFLDLSDCISLSWVHQSIGVLKRLEKLNLENCTRLKSHPDFTGISNLRVLNLSYCASLSQVDSSILVLKQLKALELGYCASLKSVPLDMTGLESLAQLTLSGCKELEKFPKIVGMTSLKVLQLDHTLFEEFPPFNSLSGLYDLSICRCSRLKEFPNLSGLKRVRWFLAYYTAITKLPSPSLLPKKFNNIHVFGHNHLPTKSGESCFDGCGLLEESSHPFRVSFLFFDYSPEVVYSYYISHGGKQINVERYFLEGLCVNYDSEHSDDVLYFGLGELDCTWSPFAKIISKDGRDIFDFLMIGASLANSGISEWFNNTTTTCSSVTLQDCLRYEEGRSTRRLEVVDTIDFTFPMDHSKLKDNRKLKGCSLFFVFEFHGPAWDSQSFHEVVRKASSLLLFACIFEKDDGIPTEPLFLWAPEVPGVGPIEYWAFVPTRWFLKHPNNWDTCSSCIRASVVPVMKFKHLFVRKREHCVYYFPSKERECEISLEEFEDLPVDVKDCRVRLVYEDDASQFYSTVAPHGLHSQYYEQSRGTARDEEMDSDEHVDY